MFTHVPGGSQRMTWHTSMWCAYALCFMRRVFRVELLSLSLLVPRFLVSRVGTRTPHSRSGTSARSPPPRSQRACFNNHMRAQVLVLQCEHFLLSVNARLVHRHLQQQTLSLSSPSDSPCLNLLSLPLRIIAHPS